MSAYRILNRNDLGGFNEAAIECILAAMARGGTARVSNRGHCIVRAPKGGTMSVSKDPTKNNRGIQNQTADFRRLFGADPWEPVVKEEAKVEQQETVTPPGHHQRQTHPTLACRANGCDKVFVTEGARYTHHQKEHHPCREPGCEFVGSAPGAESGHYRMKHTDLPHPRTVGQAKKKAKPKPRKKAVAARVPAQRKPSNTSDSQTLLAIRELLGADPRVAELEEALSKANARIDELTAKLKIIEEATHL